MSAEMRKDMFITLVYAVIDPAANTLTLARAGHELPCTYIALATESLSLSLSALKVWPLVWCLAIFLMKLFKM